MYGEMNANLNSKSDLEKKIINDDTADIFINTLKSVDSHG